MPKKEKHEAHLEPRLDGLRKLYKKALSLIQKAKEHELRGNENKAIETYFEAGAVIETLRSNWEHEIINSKNYFSRELSKLDAICASLPSDSDITALMPQILTGLNGKMRIFYKGPEKEEWKKRREEKRHKQFEQNFYLLQKELDGQKTANALEILIGINWLKLDFHRVFDLPSQYREYLDRLIKKEEGELEKLINKRLAESLHIPLKVISSYDFGLGISIYEPDDFFPDEIGGNMVDIKTKEKVKIKLNFNGKTGIDIIKFGFTTMDGYDPNIKDIWPIKLIDIEKKQGKPEDIYFLQIHNPQYKSLFSRSQDIVKRARKRADYIANKLQNL